ncbi:hypothetical protein HPB50_015843 [Hyalomma asiaticum]|uniref:Uncharacterized protein n=1 Tax=Hyalomma asiaticum TaxID=266040 RepID=A0ACB7SHG3_HYAAI|nr:hypothetical protein HPB50_015843 [Hyalomma asiaticum]
MDATPAVKVKLSSESIGRASLTREERLLYFLTSDVNLAYGLFLKSVIPVFGKVNGQLQSQAPQIHLLQSLLMKLLRELLASGDIIGRQVIDLKLCACPGRDRKNEERAASREMNRSMGSSVLDLVTDGSGPRSLANIPSHLSAGTSLNQTRPQKRGLVSVATVIAGGAPPKIRKAEEEPEGEYTLKVKANIISKGFKRAGFVSNVEALEDDEQSDTFVNEVLNTDDMWSVLVESNFVTTADSFLEFVDIGELELAVCEEEEASTGDAIVAVVHGSAEVATDNYSDG